jgi:hypothetical protein
MITRSSELNAQGPRHSRIHHPKGRRSVNSKKTLQNGKLKWSAPWVKGEALHKTWAMPDKLY